MEAYLPQFGQLPETIPFSKSVRCRKIRVLPEMCPFRYCASVAPQCSQEMMRFNACLPPIDLPCDHNAAAGAAQRPRLAHQTR